MRISLAQSPGAPLLPLAWRRWSSRAMCGEAPGYQAPGDRLRIAAAGVGAVGADHLTGCKNQEIVALSDLDHELAAPVLDCSGKAAHRLGSRRL